MKKAAAVKPIMFLNQEIVKQVFHTQTKYRCMEY